MGTRILALAHQDPRFGEIVGVDRDDDLNAGLEGSDVVIDFSDPHSTFSIAKTVAQSKRALVIGTTGLSLKTLSQVKTLSKKIPIVFSPNMSVGMNVLFDLVAKAARILAAYDIEVVEAHHHLKKDAPSGSAMKLAEVAAQASYRNVRDFVYGRQGLVGERTKKEIGISAVRAGDIVGDHTVLLAGPGERLELTHRAHSRDAFASGALEAAAWGVGRKPGLYAMKDVLNI
ncbi:MAG: 4-hydroxy-tetrahydrodipicolinate reductase [Elusimicrobia bacterium]|nr:4-hydroxy-tetrahydrodipicolinate reductase [Elusimicrobiota bacterium]